MNKKTLLVSVLLFLLVFSLVIYYLNLSQTKKVSPVQRTKKERKEGISVVKLKNKTMQNKLYTEDAFGQILRQSNSPLVPELFRRRYFIIGEIISINYQTKDVEIRTKSEKDGQFIIFMAKLTDNATFSLINETGTERDIVDISYFRPEDNVAVFFNNKAEIDNVLTNPQTVKASIIGLDGVL